MRTIMANLLLPLMIVAVLSAIMGAPVPSIGAALAEAAEIVVNLTCEIALRLARAGWALFWFCLKVACRAAAVIYGQYGSKR